MTLTQTQATLKRPLNSAPFQPSIASLHSTRIAELDALTANLDIPQLQKFFVQNKLNSEELTTYYLWRILNFDEHKLNSVTELNPDALLIARQLDAERAAGHLHGPLHGTVVLFKDNIGTGDQMHTTAGARALQTAQCDRDAFIVQKLRAAGAVILGKTAMTEWANWVSDAMPDGFSAVGGQVKNAHGSGLPVSGSSTGSAAAVAANFASFAIGTETWGSLTSPAVAHGVVTLKPTLGLISRDRIIPITDAQDTAGPFTRNVIDLALVMNAIVGVDVNDDATRLVNETSSAFASAFDQGLTPNAARGMRIGLLPATPDNEALHHAVAAVLHAVGAIVVTLPTLPNLSEDVVTAFFEICYYGFKSGVNGYLADTGAPISTLDDIVAFNQQDAADRIPYGQTYLEKSARTTLTPDTYAAAVQRVRDTAQKQIDALLATHSVDLLAGVNTALGSIVNYPGAGYPAAVLPIGFHANGKPAGMMLVGTVLDDARLIRASYAIEQYVGPLSRPDLTHWK